MVLSPNNVSYDVFTDIGGGESPVSYVSVPLEEQVLRRGIFYNFLLVISIQDIKI